MKPQAIVLVTALATLTLAACASEETTPAEPVADEPAEEAPIDGYSEGYANGYATCSGATAGEIAEEFGSGSDDPNAAARAFSQDYQPELEQGAYEGCLDALLGKPPKGSSDS